MLDKITFKAGPTPSAPQLEISLAPITIFVGPNNSGKSIVLAELENLIRTNSAANAKVLAAISYMLLTDEEIESDFELFTTKINDTFSGLDKSPGLVMNAVSELYSLRDTIIYPDLLPLN